VTQTPNDSELDRATDPEYAAVSSGAVVGLVISALGVSAFLTEAFVPAPAVGLVVSLAALRGIRRSRGVLTGRRLALAGAILGAALTVVAGGFHLIRWRQERQVLEDLEATACHIVDELVAGRYEEVYDMIPENFRERQAASPARFRTAMERLFRGGGKTLGRRLSALRIIPTEQGDLVAPAEMRVEMENRILQIQVLLGRSAEKRWELIAVGGAPTFESMMKFGDRDEEPLSPPEPDTDKDDADAPAPEPADATTP